MGRALVAAAKTRTGSIDLAQADRRFRRSLLAVATWETFWGFGAACVSNSLVLGLLTQLTSSKTLIGAYGLTQLLGLPALLATSYLSRRLRRQKRVTAALWTLQVLNWVILGAGVAVASAHRVTPILVLLFVTRSLTYLINGLAVAPTNELLATAFGRRWGTAQGLQLLCNRTAGVLGGLVATAVLARYLFPVNFGYAFLLGGAFLTASNVAILAIAEGPSPHADLEAPPFGKHLRALLSSAMSNPAFARFLWVIAFISCLAMAQGFYVVYALEHLALSPDYTGVFTTIAFAANGVGGFVAGTVGDRLGHRRLLLLALLLHLTSLLAILTMADVWQFYLVLAVGGVATVATSIATANVTVDFAPHGEKGSYVAVTQLINYPVTALSTLFGGIMIDVTGYTAIFGLSLLFPLAAAVSLLRSSRLP